MSRQEWGPTLLGAVAAMAWLAGPMPQPPELHAIVAAERPESAPARAPLPAARRRRRRPIVLRAIPSPGD